MDLCSQQCPRAVPCLPGIAVALAGLLAMGAHVSPARAEAQRVVLAGVPDVIADATATALAPWDLRVVRTAVPLPADEAAAVPEARALAEQAGAGAVVWLAPVAGGHAVLIYDASTNRRFSRPLPAGPPFDEPTAASVALSIKTLLRHSAVAPPAERVTPPPAPPAPPAPAAPELPRYSVEARTSLRLFTPGPGDASAGAEPRIGIGLAWWPDFLPRSHALGMHLALGPGVAVDKSGFQGELRDLAWTTELRRRISLGRRLDLVPAAGLGLHLSCLDGEMQPGPVRVSVRACRLTPSLDAGLDLHARIGRRWRIGAGLHAALMTRLRAHEIDDRKVARAPVLLLGAAFTLQVSL